MDETQFAAAIEGTIEMRDANVRQVQNGFIINAQNRWLDPITKSVKVQRTSEAVAASTADAATALSGFLATGTL